MSPLPSRLRTWIGAVPIDAVTADELVDEVAAAVRRRQTAAVGYLNAHVFLLAWSRPELAAALAGFDRVYCDGAGLRWGLRGLGVRLPERLTAPDFVAPLFRRLAGDGGRVFLLGDEEPVVRRAAARIETSTPGLVAGWHHGFFADAEEGAVAEAVARSGAGLVLVGMGSPRQEAVVRRLSPRVGGVWFAVGGLFRWISGAERRGPRLLTDHGFEWLCRLAVQPRHVARRYLVGLPRFLALLVRLRLRGPRPRREAPGGAAEGRR